ncbi:transglycosylase SLT domain-containing protein [Chitinispirillales bacterium ANBcel5]|uniref:lytic transglycosylase domain-containing protein n=1 Tax=Cellulosispirillum alkaliphilum TaxID=3039283 RepID=UPI002A4E3AE0|nr:transglycosylase SLT domain-containing protein [Chitinispirillales bacterium ANBcel5]
MKAKIGFITILLLSLSVFSAFLPEPVSWSGISHIREGRFEQALEEAKKDSLVADSSFHFFKKGILYANMNNFEKALEHLEFVVSQDGDLVPLAHELIATIKAEKGDVESALTSYGAVLSYSLPERFRFQVFEQVHKLVSQDSLKSDESWFRDYKAWASEYEKVDAEKFRNRYLSLADKEKWEELNTLINSSLPNLSNREVCRLIADLFVGEGSINSELSTELIFSLAQRAHRCQSHATADRLLSDARKRSDFTDVVSGSQALRLEADIAYSRAQYQRSADLYSQYDRRFGNKSEIIMQIARSHRRLGDHQTANRWYDRHLELYPASASSGEILWLRAWQSEEANDFAKAASYYRRIISRSSGRRVHESHIRLALTHYRVGEYESALSVLRTFQRQFPSSTMRWAAMFWQGKNLLALDLDEEASKVFRDLIRLDPADYYAHRARQILDEQGEVVSDLTFHPAADFEDVRTWLDKISPSGKKTLSREDSTNLRLGAMLIMMGRAEDAVHFLREMEVNYHRNLSLQFELATMFSMGGAEAQAFSVARRLAWRIPVEHREKLPVAVYNIMYPAFFSDRIVEYSEYFDVDPLLVSAVMRQESIFDYQIVSPAGAIGLMQIMPATGELIAGNLEEEFEVDYLYNPDLNIRFGTYYIRKRLNDFDNSIPLMLASYNAGPNNARRWKNRSGDSEYDLFIEDIGFTETRNYIKKVLGNYWTYQQLVQAPEYLYSGFITE